MIYNCVMHGRSILSKYSWNNKFYFNTYIFSTMRSERIITRKYDFTVKTLYNIVHKMNNMQWQKYNELFD
jgi:hypothetical protein